MKLCNDGIKLNKQKDMKIDIKNLYNTRKTKLNKIKHNSQARKRIKKFERHLNKTISGFNELILPKLTKQEKMFVELVTNGDNDNVNMSKYVNNKQNNIIIRKIRKNLESLNYYLRLIHQINMNNINLNENKLTPLYNEIKSGEYELKRIDMDIMGLQIALNNRGNKGKKSSNLSVYNSDWIPDNVVPISKIIASKNKAIHTNTKHVRILSKSDEMRIANQ